MENEDFTNLTGVPSSFFESYPFLHRKFRSGKLLINQQTPQVHAADLEAELTTATHSTEPEI